jgi:hypothetical protein
MRLYRYLIEKEDISSQEISTFVNKWKTNLESKFGVTFDLSYHFVKDRLNDKRNIKPINIEELDFVLNGFIKKFGSQLKKDVENVKKHIAKPRGKNKKELNQNELEFVVSSRSTNINFVFVLKQNFRQKGTAVILPVTIMRKKNFAITKGEEIIVERRII